jgi:uncharacterized protein YdiU (UPF0061 family)
MSKNNCTPEESFQKMRENNPRFILRNYLLHQAIEDLNNGDNKLFANWNKQSNLPTQTALMNFLRRARLGPQKAGCSMLSCSS